MNDRDLFDLVASLSHQAINQISNASGSVEHWTKTEPGDWVTQADEDVERLIREKIAQAFPDHALVGEEYGSVSTRTSDWVWYVDPIDGTTNFVSGLPWYTFSLGLVRNGIPIVGSVASPNGFGLVCADAEHITVDGKDVSSTCRVTNSGLSGSVVLTELGGTHWWPGLCELGAVIERLGGTVRILGSTALALTACALNRCVATVLARYQPWDVAGGLAICRAAGVNVFDWQGQADPFPLNGLVATRLADPSPILQFTRTVRGSVR